MKKSLTGRPREDSIRGIPLEMRLQPIMWGYHYVLLPSHTSGLNAKCPRCDFRFESGLEFSHDLICRVEALGPESRAFLVEAGFPVSLSRSFKNHGRWKRLEIEYILDLSVERAHRRGDLMPAVFHHRLRTGGGAILPTKFSRSSDTMPGLYPSANVRFSKKLP